MSGDENTKGTMTFGQEIQGITSAHLYAQQQQGNTVAQERAEEQLRHYEVAAQNILDVQRGAIRRAAHRGSRSACIHRLSGGDLRYGDETIIRAIQFADEPLEEQQFANLGLALIRLLRAEGLTPLLRVVTTCGASGANDTLDIELLASW